jgi:hypothetical protein
VPERSAEEPEPELWPREGPVDGACAKCHHVGGLVLEQRLEYLDPPEGGWPPDVPAARLASACRSCGSDFLSRSTRLVADLGAALSGAMPKVAASERPWLTCEQCQREAGAKMWPWLTCTACGRESRGRFA